mmetsp:Transcript_64703/g.189318  ORF Transcript_64703/g.189318 Transcript_64703/m.189318 type:complete len:206 (-) Transcript_64703:651-1268(-)
MSSKTSAICFCRGRTSAPCVATMLGCLRCLRTRSSLHRSGTLRRLAPARPRFGRFTATSMPQKRALTTTPKPPLPTALSGRIVISLSSISQCSARPISATRASCPASASFWNSGSKTAPLSAVAGTDSASDDGRGSEAASCRLLEERLDPACSSSYSATQVRCFCSMMSRKAMRSSNSADHLPTEAAITRHVRKTMLKMTLTGDS